MKLGLQVLRKLQTGFSCCNGKGLLLLGSTVGMMLTGTGSSPGAHKEQTEKSKSFVFQLCCLSLVPIIDRA